MFTMCFANISRQNVRTSVTKIFRWRWEFLSRPSSDCSTNFECDIVGYCAKRLPRQSKAKRTLMTRSVIFAPHFQRDTLNGLWKAPPAIRPIRRLLMKQTYVLLAIQIHGLLA